MSYQDFIYHVREGGGWQSEMAVGACEAAKMFAHRYPNAAEPRVIEVMSPDSTVTQWTLTTKTAFEAKTSYVAERR